VRRPARHGPARWLADAPGGDGQRPERRRDGSFDVAGPVPHLAGGRILVGRLPDGTSIAVPSVYVGHLGAAVEALRSVVLVGDARDLPWPLKGLAAGVGGLPDHAPVPHDWLDGPRRDGWRVAVPWQLDVGALGYGRWLPALVVARELRRIGDHRHLAGTPEHVLGALRWHGCRAESAHAALDDVLLGWSVELPNPPVHRAWSEDALA
jgi:hypothetical protein